MYPFNTLQICYRHIEDVHEGIICRKKIFLTNLQHSQLSQFPTIVHIDYLTIDLNVHVSCMKAV